MPASDKDYSDAEPEFVQLLFSEISTVSPAEFASASAVCSEVIAHISHGWPPSSAAVETALSPKNKLINVTFARLPIRLLLPLLHHCRYLVPDVLCQYVSWEKLSIDTVGPFETAVWDCHYMLTLTPFLQVYSATPHSTTGPSPFELPCGKKMRTRLDVLPLPLPVARKDARVPSQKVS